MTEDDIAGWHHRHNGQEFEKILRDSEGQGSLVCCSPWGHKGSDTTLQLNHSGLSTCHVNLQTSSTVYTAYPAPRPPGMHVPVADASLTLWSLTS